MFYYIITKGNLIAMGNLYLDVDLSEIKKLAKDMDSIMPKLQQAVAALAASTHAHVVEEAQQKLHSRRDMFMENLAFEEVGKGIWAVTVRAPAVWIEDGLPPHSMVPALLAKGAKTAKDGSKYKVIPFDQGKGPSKSTPAQASLTATIKQELRKMNIPWKTIERNGDGSVKTGMLHKLDIMNKPVKPASFPFKSGSMHGYGKGPPGQVMQGPTGIPFLQGLRIYQKAVMGPDGKPKLNKAGQQMGQRSIVTFRVVSSKHEAEGKWFYPGIEGKHFLEEAYRWAENEWDTKMVPQFLKDL